MNGRTIQVRLERRTLLGDFVHVSEREYLESAAVGQDRLVPAHESMQTAQFCDQLTAGPKRQVVSVAEQDLCTGVGNLIDCQSFDRPLGPDGHERGGFHHAMSQMQSTTPSQSFAIRVNQIKRKRSRLNHEKQIEESGF